MPINANSWVAKRGNEGLLGGKSFSFVFLVMFVYWDPVSYKNGTGSLLAQTLIRVRCSGTRCSFVKPSSESIVAGALRVLLQFLAIWPFSLQLKHFLRAKQLHTKWPGFWQLLQNCLFIWAVRSTRSFSLVKRSLVKF